MTYRDPYDSRNPRTGWNPGTIAAVVIAVIVIIGAIAYGISNNSQTASNPGMSSSPPTTTGQGGTPPKAPASPATPSQAPANPATPPGPGNPK